MSRYDACAADYCGVLNLSGLDLDCAVCAVENSSKLGQGHGIEQVQNALEALWHCKREHCQEHGYDQWARDRLQKLIDQAEAEDEAYEAERQARAEEARHAAE